MNADLLRDLTPLAVGAVVRRYGHFDLAEDAVQEALLAATQQWVRSGTPDDPKAWLIRVASRRMVDKLRSEGARRRREETVGVGDLTVTAPPGDAEPDGDDTLLLLFLCCHPALSPASQVALTLRAVGGLTTEEIAAAFLVPAPTMGQRISRAKETIRSSGVPFVMPGPDDREARLAAVLHVLYLIFNEGYMASSGAQLHRMDLSADAIRIMRQIRSLLPHDGEVSGLLALMLLIDARRRARTGRGGDLVPLADQDRSLWDEERIAEGRKLITDAMSRTPVGPYQLQAAIAALHDEAPSAGATDWRQILALYRLLDRFTDNPMVTLNHAVALAMVEGPTAGLGFLEQLEADKRVASHHRLAAVRGHMLEESGDHSGAIEQYRAAARRTTSLPERRYLERRAAELANRLA